MSYPEVRYHGEKGEISASYRPADTPAELTSGNGSQTHYLATTASTQGEFGLYKVDMTPKAGGPSTHFHKTISETFYILDGTVRLFDGAQWVDAKKGDFLYVPTGGLHAFRNDSDEPASMLLLFAPGAPREEYFEKVGTVAQMTDEERTAFFLKHDTYWTD
ncbi:MULTISPECIES: cupin domain-containing protein [Streptomyces]|uniref:Cupin domain-containing protein n=1 Tax=Streptomyces solicathayae TaxID=3081768 RepID=A0ABZ0LS15_9ACTN|nr:cupin domain-containing protein [Streptomyces sp. HUAS YS2]WOX22284.1 cupin domain-containing protein [Streptomyces sp. HUAS YS2]